MFYYRTLRQTSVKFESKCKTFLSRKCEWQYRLQNARHFVRASMQAIFVWTFMLFLIDHNVYEIKIMK